MWSSKYRPNTLSEVVGNRDQVQELSKWADSWTSHKEAVVLYGPPGVGKTTSAYALGKDKDWEIMEMNASDKRTGNIINRIAGESSKTASLTGKKRKLVILDEADNLHGNSDRGGKSAITSIVKESEQPVILIANDYYELTRTLRRNTQDIEFDYIEENEIARALKSICDEKKIDYSIDALKKIARGADGDLRGAINDLQKCATGREKIDIDDIDSVGRDQEEDIFPFLDLSLKQGSLTSVREEYRNLDMTPRDLIRWMNSNIYREYKREEEIVKGLESLSRADVWLGRTTKTQNYKYWRYASDSLSSGVASARTGKHGGWTRWQPPRYSSGKTVSDEVVGEIASTQGVSIGTVRKEIIPYLQIMISYCKPRETAVSIVARYGLDEKDLSDISGSGKSTNKVQEIVEDGNQMKNQFDIGKETSTIDESKEKDNTSENKTKGFEEDYGKEESHKNIADIVSRAKSVGSGTADNISEEFDSVKDIKEAEVDELTEIKGVSTKRAKRIKEVLPKLKDKDSSSKEETESEEKNNSANPEKGDKSDGVGLDDFI
jgi:replication factor C large subunit